MHRIRGTMAAVALDDGGQTFGERLWMAFLLLRGPRVWITRSCRIPWRVL